MKMDKWMISNHISRNQNQLQGGRKKIKAPL